jgi:response regulator RpfG family c-di-GMP phosphodiesterase
MDRFRSSGEDPQPLEAVTKGFTRSAGDRDASCIHCRRIARYATALGVALNLPDDSLVALHRASHIHSAGAITAIEPSPRIPLILQIVSLVDRFDGLTVPGPNRPAWSTEDACEILLKEALRGSRSMGLVEEFVALARSRRLSHLRQDPGVN